MQEEKVSSGRMDPQSQMLTSWEKERIHRKALEPLSEEGAGAQKTAVGHSITTIDISHEKKSANTAPKVASPHWNR